MSTLQELLPALSQGHTLKSSRGESLRLIASNKVQWVKSKGYRFEEEVISLDQVRAMHDVWSWEIVGNTQGEKQ